MGVAAQGVGVLAKSDAKECGRDWEYRRAPAGGSLHSSFDPPAAQACQKDRKRQMNESRSCSHTPMSHRCVFQRKLGQDKWVNWGKGSSSPP